MNIIEKKYRKNVYVFCENFPKNGTYWKIFTKLFTMQEKIPRKFLENCYTRRISAKFFVKIKNQKDFLKFLQKLNVAKFCVY